MRKIIDKNWVWLNKARKKKSWKKKIEKVFSLVAVLLLDEIVFNQNKNLKTVHDESNRTEKPDRDLSALTTCRRASSKKREISFDFARIKKIKKEKTKFKSKLFILIKKVHKNKAHKSSNFNFDYKTLKHFETIFLRKT